jgi:hypothetical protein
VLDVDLQMVLEVLSDAGQIRDHVDVERLQIPGVPDPRELQHLR